MAFCDKDRLARFAAGIKEKYMRKADYDSDQTVSKAGGIVKYVESFVKDFVGTLIDYLLFIPSCYLDVKVVLKGSNWSSSAPYTQTISNVGCKSESTVGQPTIYYSSTDINMDDIVKYQRALSYIKAIITNDDGSMIFIAPNAVDTSIDLILNIPIAPNYDYISKS